MKNSLIVLIAVGLSVALWFHQRARQQTLLAEQTRLTGAVEQLKRQSTRLEQAEQSAAQRRTELEQKLASRRVSLSRTNIAEAVRVSAPLVPPDPAHQGGWPSGAGYFYLSKQYLTNVSFRLLDGGHVTDEAAALVGLTAPERQAVDGAFSNLLNRFRDMEREHMQPVSIPTDWGLGNQDWFDSGTVYQIPSLASELQDAHQSFTQQLQNAVGADRGDFLTQNADNFLRQQTDDLGAGDRTIGFMWKPESDGSHSLWYGIKDAVHGDGSFQRVPDQVDPNSQIAYYAHLFGVKLPGE